MKANNKRKVFGDAVDLLMDEIEEREVPRGVQLIQIKNIQPFHDHPFHLYEGERLEDMIASVKEHGILNPVIVQKIDGGYEMLSGHNRMNAAKLAGLKEVPAIVKTDLPAEEAYVYVIETNLMQRSFSDLLISEKAAVLKARYEKGACQGKRNDIVREIARLEGKAGDVTSGHCDQKLTTRDSIGKADITHMIKRVANRAERTILEKRYLCFDTWEQISVDMGYSIQHTFRLHDKALKEIDGFLKVES